MRGRYIWAIILVILGLLLLLSNLNLIGGVTWGVFWGLVVIAIGLGLILSNRGRAAVAAPAVDDNMPLEGAVAARVVVNHGAGRLIIRGGEAPGYLAWGRFGGGVRKTGKVVNGTLEARLELPPEGWIDRTFAWTGTGAIDWDVTFNSALPLELKLQTGASDQHVDLSLLKLTRFELNTGASSTTIVLPAQAGYTQARIASGAASIKIVVPPTTALRVRSSVGMGSVNVDRNRFPQTGAGFESPGFDAAANRVELSIEGGMASFDIR